MTERIKKILDQATNGVGEVMIPENAEFGHYSTNAAFLLSKSYKKPPLQVAQEIAERIERFDEEKILDKVTVAAPGFVNFWVNKKVFKEELARVISQEQIQTTEPKQKINIEFVSANPTGPLTMANGRGGFLGDVLANVLSAVGHEVTREYYINDAGNQVKLLGESILAALGKMKAKEEHYRGAYVQELAKKLNGKFKKEDPEMIGRLASKELLKQIKVSLKKAGIQHDVWFSEYQNLRKGGLVDAVLNLLRQKGLVDEHDGAFWLKTSEIADEKDRVLVKSDGQPTYFLADIAYHYDKFVSRQFDKAIDIWGADHHGYIARLKSGVKAMDLDANRLTILITQLVRLIRGGKEIKMSKRKGEFVTMDELLSEVGADAARFFFLMHAPETHMDFDLDLAKERSMKNPVYYAQYAYIRCKSILEKANFALPEDNAVLNLEKIEGEAEISLIKELVKYPELVLASAKDYQVSRLARYAFDLARAVHNFYEKERVIVEDGELMSARLNLIWATKEMLTRLFNLLGIAAPKKM